MPFIAEILQGTPNEAYPVLIRDCRGKYQVAGALRGCIERRRFNRDFARYLGTGKITAFLRKKLWN